MEKLAVTVPEMAKMLGIGINNAYMLTKRRDFPSIRVGKKILVPVEALKKWVIQESREGMG